MRLLLLKSFMGFFLALILFQMNAHAFDISTYGQSPEWRAILHYKAGILGGEKSEVTGDHFFLSKTGATDSVAELVADMHAVTMPLSQNESPNDHAICKFPARVHLMEKAGLVTRSQLPKLSCPIYQVYKTRIQTKKVSVVFSSYYLGSSSSVFGHSFLKFSGDNENELFDTGINFSATPTTKNPILYALFGLTGVFPSSFSAQPFYFKVREYNDFESRDLWTYELNLTAEERNTLLDHLWELGSTTFRYYYFNQNCSYHILRAVEAAVPRIQIYTKRPVYLIPSESIHDLYRPANHQTDLVKAVSFRPSLRNVAYFRYANLGEHDQNLVTDALAHQKVFDLKSAARPANTLDTLMDAVDLAQAEKILAKDPDALAWKDMVLKSRADLAEVSARASLPVPELENPALGHGSRRLALQYGQEHTLGAMNPYVDLQLRASHHDLLDPSIGYPPNLHIDFGRIGFRYFTRPQQFVLRELTVVDLTALAVKHPLFSHVSYDALIAYDRTVQADCADRASCGALRVRGGVGRAYSLFKGQTLFFLFNAEPKYGFHYFGSHFKFEVSHTSSMLYEFTPRIKGQISGTIGETWLADHAFSLDESVELRYGVNDQFGFGTKISFQQQYEFTHSRIALKGFYYF